MTPLSLPRYTLWLFVFRNIVPLVSLWIISLSGLQSQLTGFLGAVRGFGDTLIPVALAALVVGRRFAIINGREIQRHEALRFARLAAVRFVFVEAIGVFGAPLISGNTQLFQGYVEMLSGPYGLAVLGLMAACTIVSIPLNQRFVAMGARDLLKLSNLNQTRADQ